MRVEFTVHGEPKAKARPRLGKTGHIYTPKTTKDYEDIIALEYMVQGGKFLKGEISMTFDFYFKIPQSMNLGKNKKTKADMKAHRIRPVKRPDLDNLIKIYDALNGLAFNDDSQIVTIIARKWYGEEPKTVVVLEKV